VIDWARIPCAGGRRIPLPTYAFDCQRFWVAESETTSHPVPPPLKDTTSPVFSSMIDAAAGEVERCQEEAPSVMGPPDVRAHAEMRRFGELRLLAALQDAGLFRTPGESVTTAEYGRLAARPEHGRLLQAFLRILERGQFVRVENGIITCTLD